PSAAEHAQLAFDHQPRRELQTACNADPLAYGRSTAVVQTNLRGWWEFGKSSAAFADLVLSEPAKPPSTPLG
ncbi:MAG TPA: hypothetical protein VIL73_01360, partial [Gaiellaceae bacterium]